MPNKLLNTITDEDLVLEIKSGNQLAMEVLFDKYAPAVLGILKHSTESVEKAEEALLVFFGNISHQIGDFDPSKMKLFTWMLCMVKKMMKENGQNQIQTHNNYVFDKGTLSNTLGRSLLDLVMFEGFTYDELTEITGITRYELNLKIREELNQMKKKQ